MTLIIAAKVIWGLGIAAWYVIRHPYARQSRRVATLRQSDRVQERALLACASLGLFIIPLVYVATNAPRFANYPLSPVQAALGTLVFAGALWLFHRAHKDLGKHWSAVLEIREQHTLVRTGVYSRIRHPMYASFWLWAIAQALLLPNFIAGPAGLIGIGLLYFLRIGREEQLMLDTFGDEYRRYMSETKRIVPGVY